MEVSRWRRVAADDDVALFFRPCRKHSSDLFSDDDDGFPAAEPARSALVVLVLASSTAFLAVQMIALACSSVASTPRPTAAAFSATAAPLCMLGFVVMADWLS